MYLENTTKELEKFSTQFSCLPIKLCYIKVFTFEERVFIPKIIIHLCG